MTNWIYPWKQQFTSFPPSISIDRSRVGVHFHPERINRVDCLWFVHDSALCVIYLRGMQLDETFFCRWRIDKSNTRGCFVFLANDLTAKGWSPFLDGLLFRIFDIVSLIRTSSCRFENFVNLINSLKFFSNF